MNESSLTSLIDRNDITSSLSICTIDITSQMVNYAKRIFHGNQDDRGR